MRQYISLFTLLLFFCQCATSGKHTEIYCRGDINTDPMINHFEPCSYCNFKAVVLNGGFEINISDSAYKVTAFKIFISDNSGTFFRKTILGNRVTKKNVKMISKLKAGDVISIECINVFGKGERSMATGMTIGVDK
ncbi:hypothetical protein LQ567_19775 [Niabella pedocola]|uniref:Gliding motility-associated protein GldM C-terminal domain-containing protein n=1 Tax=Niabella pedocola TaxID=1752077 RepID=A0ABS8PVD6_9BACT|nr:GldM family protein [Niabella pedocola]MCD2425034.1 hypothetical protein [Niabella pedocola]